MPNIGGFYPIDSRYERTNRYRFATGTKIFRGDPVVLDANGRVTPAAAAAARLLGIAAHSVEASQPNDTEVLVYDDPNALFMVSMNADATLTDPGDQRDFEIPAGDSTRNVSNARLLGTAVNGQFIVTDLFSNDTRSATPNETRFVVRIAKHQLTPNV